MREVSKTSRMCKRLLGSLPAIKVGNGPVNVAVQCRRGYEIGYRCAAPQVFNLIADNTKLAGRLDAALNTKECQRAPGPLKLLCAIGSVVDQFAVRPALCMAAVVSKGGFTQLASGDSKTIEAMCTEAGEFAFRIAVERAIGKRSRGRDNTARMLRRLRKIKKVAKKGRKLERFFSATWNGNAPAAVSFTRSFPICVERDECACRFDGNRNDLMLDDADHAPAGAINVGIIFVAAAVVSRPSKSQGVRHAVVNKIEFFDFDFESANEPR